MINRGMRIFDFFWFSYVLFIATVKSHYITNRTKEDNIIYPDVTNEIPVTKISYPILVISLILAILTLIILVFICLSGKYKPPAEEDKDSGRNGPYHIDTWASQTSNVSTTQQLSKETKYYCYVSD